MTDVIEDKLNPDGSSPTKVNNDEINKATNISNDEKKGLLEEIKRERDKRHSSETRLEELEAEVKASKTTITNTPSNETELEAIVDGLAPVLQKRGFITLRQQEDETRAKDYAKELKDLSSEFDGSDGRPKFDSTEVSNHAKRTNNFNLKSAYRDLHWKQLIDFEKKNINTEDYKTEIPVSLNTEGSQRVPLTQEYLKNRLAQPDGREWYKKNRDKIINAMSKGKI